MKIGIILETKEYEKAWNAFRSASASKKNNRKIFYFFLSRPYFLLNFSTRPAVSMSFCFLV